GDASRIDRPFPFSWRNDDLVYTGTWGLPACRRLGAWTGEARREDVSAWLQEGTERVVVEAVRHWIGERKATRLALAGGLFANVCVNGRLAALPEVEALHVFPHMGDGGLAAGAALHVASPLPAPLDSLHLGPGFTEASVEAVLCRAGLCYTRPADPDGALLHALLRGEAVVRCIGRMESGPRALGHRSVLAPAHDPTVTGRLNAALCRDDFLPFAPVLPVEEAASAFPHVTEAAGPLRTMTVALPARAAFAGACPAAVHRDGTSRPQVVHPHDDQVERDRVTNGE
ncbi:MAG: carbamoyltransferase C-terminal domain-containing protein, partial [Planctomycetota bacterium]